MSETSSLFFSLIRLTDEQDGAWILPVLLLITYSLASSCAGGCSEEHPEMQDTQIENDIKMIVKYFRRVIRVTLSGFIQTPLYPVNAKTGVNTIIQYLYVTCK